MDPNDLANGSKCSNAVVVIVPMHRWAFFLGHEQCNEMFARLKEGHRVEFHMRVACGECADCKEYEERIKHLPMIKLEEADGGGGWLRQRCQSLKRRLKDGR